MNPNKNRKCEEMKNYIDNTLRADIYLAVKWRLLIDYYLSQYSEDDVKACLPHLGVEVRGDTIFLWAGEYYSRLVEALADAMRRGGYASMVADPYEGL